jgi:hypothetical protein
MSLHRIPLWAAVVLVSAALPVRPQQAGGPVLGLIVDGAGHRIRPVLGVPGAAVVGPAIDAGAGVSAEAASPRGDYVVVLAGDARQPALWLADGSLRALPGVPAAPDRVAVSPEGAAAGLYYLADSRILLVSGLPDAPALSAAIQLTPSRRPFREIAVSDDGKLALVVEDGAAVAMSSPGDLNRIVLSAPVEALAFAHNSHDAVLAGGSEAVLIRSVEVPGERVVLATDGLEGIAAAAVSRDGRSAYLASARSGKVAVVSLDGGHAAVTLECPCSPGRLIRMNDQSSYRLTEYSGESLYVLDGAATPPRIVVAPPPLERDK